MVLTLNFIITPVPENVLLVIPNCSKFKYSISFFSRTWALEMKSIIAKIPKICQIEKSFKNLIAVKIKK